jgi:pyruvate formate lyase activating enzyme
MNKALLVGGVVSLSTVDYPDYISSVIFLQGCGWGCKYCHNQHLQPIELSHSLPWEDILELLRSRRGFVDAVVFSGGEPLIQEALPDAIMEVKNMGFMIGLHTAGAVPEMLAKVAPMTDWIGFDVKNDFKDYELITGVPNSGKTALESLKLLVALNVNFEVRITMYKTLEISVIVDLLKELSSMGVKTVALQKCRDIEEIIVEHPIFSDRILLEDISKYFENFFVR